MKKLAKVGFIVSNVVTLALFIWNVFMNNSFAWFMGIGEQPTNLAEYVNKVWAYNMAVKDAHDMFVFSLLFTVLYLTIYVMYLIISTRRTES